MPAQMSAVSASMPGQSRLGGRVAAVTGAGGAIGQAIAVRLGREGAAVIAAARTASSAERAAAAVRAAGGTARGLVVDVTRAEMVEDLAPFALHELGSVPDILVCCAGAQTFADVFDLPLPDWDRVFDVNARGTFLTLRAVGRVMRDAGRGSIVTVASIQARLGNPVFAHYSASKAAVLSLTRSFALALAPRGVRVNAVAPGFVAAGLGRTADAELARIHGLARGEPTRRRVAAIPLGRAGTPEDVAAAVAFLASDDADYITGECLHVCGGDVMP